MTRRPAGQQAPQAIPGDRGDLAGFPRLVEEFCEAIAACGYSPRTIRNRRAMLAFLAAWLPERGITRPADVTRPVLESYQRHLFHHRKKNGDPLSFRSQSQRLLAVRAFFKWAARGRTAAPQARAHRGRGGAGAGPARHNPLGVRDRAILEVFCSTGIRRSELASLAVTDIDHARQTLLVRQGKGKQDRMIPIGERALAWVSSYLAEARPTRSGR